MRGIQGRLMLLSNYCDYTLLFLIRTSTEYHESITGQFQNDYAFCVPPPGLMSLRMSIMDVQFIILLQQMSTLNAFGGKSS